MPRLDTVGPMLAFGHRLSTAAPSLPAPGAAGVATATLRGTGFAGRHSRPQCLAHHVLMLVNAGHGTVEVDFTARRCRPGTLLWIRPGQAVRLGGDPALDAVLVTWDRSLTIPAEGLQLRFDDPFAPGHWQLAGEDEDAVISEISQLVVDCQRHTSGPTATALLRHELAVLLLRVALVTEPSGGPVSRAEARTFVRFQQELNRRQPISRRVEEYATRLGCSVRTLTRASLAVTGRSAKQVLDDRVALEAKRMLACSQLSIAEVGRRLGFAEPTNFGRFFHREVGRSPGVFRSTVLSTPVVPGPRQPTDS